VISYHGGVVDAELCNCLDHAGMSAAAKSASWVEEQAMELGTSVAEIAPDPSRWI
jgi:hypothetical protein